MQKINLGYNVVLQGNNFSGIVGENKLGLNKRNIPKIKFTILDFFSVENEYNLTGKQEVTELLVLKSISIYLFVNTMNELETNQPNGFTRFCSGNKFVIYFFYLYFLQHCFFRLIFDSSLYCSTASYIFIFFTLNVHQISYLDLFYWTTNRN